MPRIIPSSSAEAYVILNEQYIFAASIIPKRLTGCDSQLTAIRRKRFDGPGLHNSFPLIQMHPRKQEVHPTFQPVHPTCRIVLKWPTFSAASEQAAYRLLRASFYVKRQGSFAVFIPQRYLYRTSVLRVALTITQAAHPAYTTARLTPGKRGVFGLIF